MIITAIVVSSDALFFDTDPAWWVVATVRLDLCPVPSMQNIYTLLIC